MMGKRFAALLAFLSLSQLSVGSAFQSCDALHQKIGAASPGGECAGVHVASGALQGSKSTTAPTAPAPKHEHGNQSPPCCVALATCGGCGMLGTTGGTRVHLMPRSRTLSSSDAARLRSPSYRPNPPPPKPQAV
jgi:hypothetical protein